MDRCGMKNHLYGKLSYDDKKSLLDFLNKFKSSDEFSNNVMATKNSEVQKSVIDKIIVMREKNGNFKSIDDIEFLEDVESDILLETILSICKININTISVDKLVNYLGVNENIAKEIVSNKPYDNLEDILKISEIEKNISLNELLALSQLDHDETHLTGMVDESSTLEKWNLKINYGTMKNKTSTRVFISYQKNEIISAEINGKNDIKYSTLKLFSYTPRELLTIDQNMIKKLTQLMHSEDVKEAGDIWSGDISKIDQTLQNPIKILSQHVFLLLQHTSQKVYKKSEDCTPNGCTSSPDFNFIECCNAHDLCYCHGGSEEDRYICDRIFFDCVRNKAGTIIAWIYYTVVRIAGASHFNFDARILQGSNGFDVDETTPESTTQKCNMVVTLKHIQYSCAGDDIGNDIKCTFGINGTSTTMDYTSLKFNHGDIKTPNREITPDISGNCGDRMTIRISAVVYEDDPISDDRGSVLIDSDPIICRNNSTGRHSIKVNVGDRSKWGKYQVGTFIFSFDVVTSCANS